VATQKKQTITMSLILDGTKINNCTAVIKELVPEGSIIDSYLLYNAKMELFLASDKRFVVANTSNKHMFILWQCLTQDPKKIYEIVSSDVFKFANNEGTHAALQEMWHEQSDPYLLSAMFFLLNRCSESGLASSGEIDLEKLSPAAIQKIKGFTAPESFYVNYIKEDFIEHIKTVSKSDYVLIPAGEFDYGLFKHGRSVAPEQTPVKHRDLVRLCGDTNKKVILTYNYNQKVVAAYRGHRTILIDKYGKKTIQPERAKEILIANF